MPFDAEPFAAAQPPPARIVHGKPVAHGGRQQLLGREHQAQGRNDRRHRQFCAVALVPEGAPWARALRAQTSLPPASIRRTRPYPPAPSRAASAPPLGGGTHVTGGTLPLSFSQSAVAKFSSA